ncbi:MAG: outer membrane beta-barrel protein [Hyphomicrobiales bacterium]
MLKKVLFATAATVMISMPAMAADVVEAPPVSSWTAFYLGAGIGAAWSNFDASAKYCYEDGELYCYKDFYLFPYGLQNLFDGDSDTAFRGIGQIGFDWEVAPSFVLGVFGDVNFGQQTGVSNSYYYEDDYDCYDGCKDKFSYGVDTLWTLGGRAGWGTENTLFYGLVGYSWADAELKLKFDCLEGTSDCIYTGKSDDTLNGWTFGGGIEFKGWLWDGVSTSIEYRYTDLDSVSATVEGDDYDYVKGKVDQDIQQVNLVFKYRFGGM